MHFHSRRHIEHGKSIENKSVHKLNNSPEISKWRRFFWLTEPFMCLIIGLDLLSFLKQSIQIQMKTKHS